MEAKDTVISDVTPVTLLQNQRELYGLLREQAELSFKAEYEEEREVWNKAIDIASEQSFKAGIKEVVEWIKSNASLERGDRDVGLCFEDYLHFDYYEFQAQLEKWGIDDKAL